MELKKSIVTFAPENAPVLKLKFCIVAGEFGTGTQPREFSIVCSCIATIKFKTFNWTVGTLGSFIYASFLWKMIWLIVCPVVLVNNVINKLFPSCVSLHGERFLREESEIYSAAANEVKHNNY